MQKDPKDLSCLDLDQKVEKCCFLMSASLDVIKGDNAFCRFFNATDLHSLCPCMLKSDVAKLTSLLKKATQDKTITYSCNIKARGKKRLCLLYFTPLESGDFSVMLYDTFCLHSMMETLSYSEEKNSNLLSLLNAVFFIYDIKSKTFSVNNTQSIGNPITFSLKDFDKMFFSALEEKGQVFPASDSLCDFDNLKKDIENGTADKSYTFVQEKNQDMCQDYKEITLITKYLTFNFLSKGQILGVFGSTDNSTLISLGKEITIDGLTGVMNKKSILEYARVCIDQEKIQTTLMIMDLDDFKQINDSYGHAFGDDVIVKFSQVLTSSVANQGKIGRFGGDEFFVVLTGVQDIPTIRDIARNIRLGIQWAYTNQLPDLILTCSIGIARYPIDRANFKDTFALSDSMLYLAKARGKNRYVYYNPVVHKDLNVNEIITAKMLAADNLNKFYMQEQNQILQALFLKKTGWQDYVMTGLVNLLKLQSISVYKFENKTEAKLFKFFSLQKDSKDPRDKKIDSTYTALFDKNEVLVINNVLVYEVAKRWLFNMFVGSGVNSSYEFLLKKDDSPLFLICFDRGYPARRWTDSEQFLLNLICTNLKEYCLEIL